MFDDFEGGARHRDGPLAARDVRLLAYLFDRGLFAVFFLPTVSILAVAPPEASSMALLPLANVAAWLAGLGLFVTQWVLLSRRGQSLGKIAVGIRIERPDGSLPGFLRVVVLRDWVLGVFAACGVLALIDALFIFGEDRRTLHDRLADTRVVRVEGS